MGIGRDAAHFVMRPVILAQFDTDAVQRVMAKIFPAHGVAALHRLDEFLFRGGQIRNHHLATTPVFPNRAREHHGAVGHLALTHMLGPAKFGKQLAFALFQPQRLAQPPRPQREKGDHARRKSRLAVTTQLRLPFAHESGLALVRIKCHQQVHHRVHHGKNARVIGRVIAVEQLQILDGRAQRRVVKIMHPERRVGPDAQGGFANDAKLAVTEDHAPKERNVLAIRALHDVAGGRDHLQRQRLIRAATKAR